MSAWRREASERLPELQPLISSRRVANPMRLWIELYFEFERAAEQQPPRLDLLRRMWGYAEWCLRSRDGSVRTAAALAFCEHLIDARACRELLPELMSRQDYEGCRELLLHHNSEGEYEAGLRAFDVRRG